MPSLDNQDTANRSSRWLGIVQTAMIQVMVLLALSVAVVYYLDWSSEKAWEEFLAASKSSSLVPRQQSTPVLWVDRQAPCERRA